MIWIRKHLVRGLTLVHDYMELNVHTLWALLAARPLLLRDAYSVSRSLRQQIPVLLDSGQLSVPARRELVDIRYAIRLAAADKETHGG